MKKFLVVILAAALLCTLFILNQQGRASTQLSNEYETVQIKFAAADLGHTLRQYYAEHGYYPIDIDENTPYMRHDYMNSKVMGIRDRATAWASWVHINPIDPYPSYIEYRRRSVTGAEIIAYSGGQVIYSIRLDS